jgi:hypothetical protein
VALCSYVISLALTAPAAQAAGTLTYYRTSGARGGAAFRPLMLNHHTVYSLL